MKEKNSDRLFQSIILFSIVLVILAKIGSIVYPRYHIYLSPYYTEEIYKHLENTYNNSQYRQKNPTSLIPDEIVFSYASGAYLHGVDPIYINSEHTPLGKYFIALSILFLKNDRFIVLPFGLFTLIMIWLLSRTIIKNSFLALLPVLFFSFEPLFLNQLIYTPLLDIIQLPFILLSLYAFIVEQKKKIYVFTAISLGLVMSTKTIMPAILLVGCFILYFLIYRKFTDIKKFILFLPLSGVIFFASYTKTFLDGYNLNDFYKFQKWIFLYQKSKLIFPFSVWRLVFLNQWQAWWGDMSILKAEDWQITWPLFTSLSFVTGLLALMKKIRIDPPVTIFLLWILIYGAFLSLGVVSSRFLLPFLPIAYILGIYLIGKIERTSI